MKGTLIAIMIIVFAAIIFFFWLSFENLGSDKIISSAIKLLGAVLLAVGLFSIDFIQDEKFNYSHDILMIYHDNGEPFDLSTVLSSIDSENGKGFSELTWLPKQTKPQVNKELKTKLAFEDFQFAFWNWFSKQNPNHWDLKRTWFQSIGGGGGGAYANSGAEKSPEKLDVKQTISQISERFNKTVIPNICLPSGTKLTVESNDSYIKYSFENSHYLLNFEIYITGGGRIGSSRLGQNLNRIFLNTDDWSTVRLRTQISGKYKKYRRWSNKSIRIKKWVGEINNMFEKDFSWKIIKPEFEESITSFNWQKHVTPSSVVKK